MGAPQLWCLEGLLAYRISFTYRVQCIQYRATVRCCLIYLLTHGTVRPSAEGCKSKEQTTSSSKYSLREGYLTQHHDEKEIWISKVSPWQDHCYQPKSFWSTTFIRNITKNGTNQRRHYQSCCLWCLDSIAIPLGHSKTDCCLYTQIFILLCPKRKCKCWQWCTTLPVGDSWVIYSSLGMANVSKNFFLYQKIFTTKSIQIIKNFFYF